MSMHGEAVFLVLQVRADAIMSFIKEISKEKAGAFCTDNASNLRLARSIAAATEGYKHIV